MKVRRNNLFAADGTNEIRKRISLVLYYDSDVRSEPMDFREVFLQNQALEGITLSMLMLGDIVISVETATRQAEERGHKLIDEIRVLMEFSRCFDKIIHGHDKEPVLFLKRMSSYLMNGGTFEVPHPLLSLDHEVELAVIIY
ncbi:hypothetical protein ACFX13_017337 [Malus domestica]|uniref:Uncharacterized protein n=1 Tax=Malus domestica TaxID=3750 RepID=A0A498HSU5_MALDO|nr:hypothetical protein DVH24_012221 [Malus domestica]